MNGNHRIFVHAGLAVTAAVFAIGVWTRDKQPKALVQSDVTVWQGKPKDVESIVYDGKKKRLELSAKKDDLGRYFVGSVEKDKAAAKPQGDAAAPEPAAAEKVATGIVSITPAEKLLDVLAPLKAIRAVGQVPADREAEFGLAEPEGTLTVKLGGAERKLLFGGPTPGGADRYVRDPGSGEVYVVKGQVFRDVDGAESSLLERDLHEWKDTEIGSAKVIAGGKSRTVVRGGPEAKRFWADEGAKETADETIGNWMSKVDRLRPTEYVLTAPDPRETVVRIEYAGPGGTALGHLEIVRGPTGDSGKSQYFVVTERTRLHGKVTGSVGEQVEQDVASIVK
jgi:hypothetical protein